MAAENIVQVSGFEYLILRTQVLYGTGSKVRPNFVTWLLDNLKAGKKVQVVWDQIGSPTYASDVAEAAERLLQAQAYGLFHVSSPDTMSRFDFAQKIAEVFKLDSALIEKIKTTDLSQKSPRPQNSSFNLDKIYNNINWQPRSVEQALEQLKSEMAKKHD